MATSANILSKALQKLLDKRYEGAVRLVSRAVTEDEILALWEKLRDAGRIGAAYWAIMSHTHVPAEITRQVFGEVHMLSHLHGRGAREMATQIAESEARLRRAEAARNEGARRARCGARPTRRPSCGLEHDGSERPHRPRLTTCHRAQGDLGQA
jgi:hypothetical protein